jgi:hypothetical protein
MNILKNIRQKNSWSICLSRAKKTIKLQTQRIIEKHRLNDPVECQKIIDQYIWCKLINMPLVVNKRAY